MLGYKPPGGLSITSDTTAGTFASMRARTIQTVQTKRWKCRGICPPAIMHGANRATQRDNAQSEHSQARYPTPHLFVPRTCSRCKLRAVRSRLPLLTAASSLLRSRSPAVVAATPRKARCQCCVAAPRGILGMAGPAGPAHGEPSAPESGEAAGEEEGRDGRRVVPNAALTRRISSWSPPQCH